MYMFIRLGMVMPACNSRTQETVETLSQTRKMHSYIYIYTLIVFYRYLPIQIYAYICICC